MRGGGIGVIFRYRLYGLWWLIIEWVCEYLYKGKAYINILSVLYVKMFLFKIGVKWIDIKSGL